MRHASSALEIVNRAGATPCEILNAFTIDVEDYFQVAAPVAGHRPVFLAAGIPLRTQEMGLLPELGRHGR